MAKQIQGLSESNLWWVPDENIPFNKVKTDQKLPSKFSWRKEYIGIIHLKNHIEIKTIKTHLENFLNDLIGMLMSVKQ